jgi:hypothetical protein
MAGKSRRAKLVLTQEGVEQLERLRLLAEYRGNAFGQVVRTFLRHNRVQSWEELRDRILLGVSEINAAPMFFRVVLEELIMLCTWRSFSNHHGREIPC